MTKCREFTTRFWKNIFISLNTSLISNPRMKKVKYYFKSSGFTDSQQCNRIVVENSRVQQGSEGVYEMIDDVICSVRPVYQQIWPNFSDRYIVFGWSFHQWLNGLTYENCNDTNEVSGISFIVQDGASSPDKVTQSWIEYGSSEWQENTDLTVICDY